MAEAFRKSSYSLSNGDCVEVAAVELGAAVRDSKDQDGPVLAFSGEAWTAFLVGIMQADFDRI